MRLKVQPLLGCLLCLMLVSFGPLVSAAEQNLKIIGPWEGEGKLYKVGVDEFQFIGTFEGIMYIDSGEEELNAAIFVCPTTQTINATSNTTKAKGRCHIIAAAGNVFADFECNGVVGKCEGKFKVTGGTDELEGITGSSDMIVKAALGGLTMDTQSGSVARTAAGLAIWPNMKIKMPKVK